MAEQRVVAAPRPGDQVTAVQVADLVARFVGLNVVPPGTSLAAIGLDDRALLQLWLLATGDGAVAPEEEDLVGVDTVGDLVDAIVRTLEDAGQTWRRPPGNESADL